MVAHEGHPAMNDIQYIIAAAVIAVAYGLLTHYA